MHKPVECLGRWTRTFNMKENHPLVAYGNFISVNLKTL